MSTQGAGVAVLTAAVLTLNAIAHRESRAVGVSVVTPARARVIEPTDPELLRHAAPWTVADGARCSAV